MDSALIPVRPGVAFILITVLIDSIGVGLIIPVMPALIRQVQGTGLASAVLWSALLAGVFAVMQFLFGPLLGALPVCLRGLPCGPVLLHSAALRPDRSHHRAQPRALRELAGDRAGRAGAPGDPAHGRTRRGDQWPQRGRAGVSGHRLRLVRALAAGSDPTAALPGVITPALQGIMSKRVGDDAQGELQRVMNSVSSIAMIPSFAVMSLSFWGFAGDQAPVFFPGAPFAVSAALMGVALVVFLRGMPRGATVRAS